MRMNDDPINLKQLYCQLRMALQLNPTVAWICLHHERKESQQGHCPEFEDFVARCLEIVHSRISIVDQRTNEHLVGLVATAVV